MRSEYRLATDREMLWIEELLAEHTVDIRGIDVRRVVNRLRSGETLLKELAEFGPDDDIDRFVERVQEWFKERQG